MEIKKCFEASCILDIEYVCPCTSPQTYCCEIHIGKHLKLPDRTHNFNTFYLEPHEGTKEAILMTLAKEDSKHNKLKKKILSLFSQNILESENNLEELIKTLNSTLGTIKFYFSKISQVKKISKSEQDPILGLLRLQPDEAVEKIKIMIPNNPDWYNSAKSFCGFSEKIEKMIECFIKDKFEAYLDERLMKIEKNIDENYKNTSLENKELENTKILEIINDNQREFESWKGEIDQKIKKETTLLNSKLIDAIEDLNLKLKNLEKTQYSINKSICKETIKENISETLTSPNCPELEMKFRKTCSEYEINSSFYDSESIEAYENYITTYQTKTSLYNLAYKDNKTNLLIYNTETESQDFKILQDQVLLNNSTCIAQLPNNKLFCFGTDNELMVSGPIEYGIPLNIITSPTGFAWIISQNGEIQVLPPSGTFCKYSSCIYFKNNVYCFGGEECSVRKTRKFLTLSRRFDLEKDKWIELTSMPKADCLCNSVIFKGNILIAGYSNRNLLVYSIENNVFITHNYKFAKEKRKIIINAERLYLIECSGSIYESEIGSDNAWRRIASSIIKDTPDQVYCSYNKGAIYIGCNCSDVVKYYKFNLNEKSLNEKI